MLPKNAKNELGRELKIPRYRRGLEHGKTDNTGVYGECDEPFCSKNCYEKTTCYPGWLFKNVSSFLKTGNLEKQ